MQRRTECVKLWCLISDFSKWQQREVFTKKKCKIKYVKSFVLSLTLSILDNLLFLLR
jgi:hypothetical protein